MVDIIAGVVIPDTSTVDEATRLAGGMMNAVLFHHSRRVFLFSSLHAKAMELKADPELLYVAALFHDTGVLTPFSDSEQRFELDSADHSRAFLLGRGFSPQAADTVWSAIALHTTPDIPGRMGPEIAATTLGILTDVVGVGLETFDPSIIEEITAAHPRGDFKNGFLQTFHDGLKHRPNTTFGTMNADILAEFEPGFRRINMVERVRSSSWST